MDGCRGEGVWTLCFLLLLLEAGSATDTWERALHAEEVGVPGDPQEPRDDHCPPPPQTLPPGACQAARCQADSECPRHERCCYNGCRYACLEAVPPPPVLDWLVQPKPRWLGGNGWLLDGPEEVVQVVACSTTEDGAEPLLCPTGYECHILSPGDMAKGVPNHGQCVKQRQQAGLLPGLSGGLERCCLQRGGDEQLGGHAFVHVLLPRREAPGRLKPARAHAGLRWGDLDSRFDVEFGKDVTSQEPGPSESSGLTLSETSSVGLRPHAQRPVSPPLSSEPSWPRTGPSAESPCAQACVRARDPPGRLSSLTWAFISLRLREGPEIKHLHFHHDCR